MDVRPKPVVFLYASIKQLKNETSSTIASTHQIFRNKSNKRYTRLLPANDKILLKEMKHPNKWKDVLILSKLN